jgi:SAM-dependent methyltransferase
VAKATVRHGSFLKEMAADPSIYECERLAESYSKFRPPVHQAICARMFERMALGTRLRSAVDMGCGAGASTKALLPHVDHVTGVDPYTEMLKHARSSVPSATFVLGRFESIPFSDASFPLVASAGAINYADVKAALAQTSRVLEAGGWFAAYDFSAARRFTKTSSLPECYAEFRAKFPSSPGYALELKSLPYSDYGLHLVSHERFEVNASMSLEDYVCYLLGDSGVELAIGAGAREAEVAEYCLQLFSPVFVCQNEQVVFDAELLLALRLSSPEPREAPGPS